ncbi:TetR/AcrR family transcriptional regulator [Nonomuraea sp. NPDC003560]
MSKAGPTTGGAGGVWLRPATRPGREGPPLTRERIIAEALALLDEEGVDRLTMRRLAQRLGTGSTTLYWHVKTKDDVLDLTLDMIFGEIEIPARDNGDWRGAVITLANRWRAVLLKHPWSAVLLGRPMLGPNVLTRSEFLYSTLVKAGVTEPHLTGAAYSLSNYIIGSALMQATWSTNAEPGVRQAAGEHLRANQDSYPILATHGPLVAGDDWDTGFGFGLTWLLDGIAKVAGAGA